MIRGAAAVAGVHRCIGLDVGNPLAVTDRIEAADGTDDAGRHGVVQAEGIADGNGPFPRLELVGVAQGRHRQVVGHHFHHRYVGEGVGAENLALEIASVRQGYRHLIGTTHHVLIGEIRPLARVMKPEPWPCCRWLEGPIPKIPPKGLEISFTTSMRTTAGPTRSTAFTITLSPGCRGALRG